MPDDTMLSLPSRPISGLGPHGEFPATVEHLVVSDAAAEEAARARYSVALVLHTMTNDWAKLQIAAIQSALARHNATLAQVVECSFRPERQAEVLDGLLSQVPDAIISVPVGLEWVADALRRVGTADIKLVLMDNVPVGMVAGRDYASVISCDNFGNGEIAADVLAGHIPEGGHAIVVGYNIDFHVTNERELGFRRWFRGHRPDVTIERVQFKHPEDAGSVVSEALVERSDVDGLFVVWDEPALLVAEAVRAAGRDIPISTVDLGGAVARDIARGGLIKGVGATLAYDQGVAEATATIMALAGDEPPPWVVLPALSVTRGSIIDGYEAVWHESAPAEIRDALHNDGPERSP